MTNTKQRPLVPITREFLRLFYQKYPLAPVPYEERLVHLKRVEELTDTVTKPGSKVPEHFGIPSPTRIDDCFWRNRMICEELALSASKLQENLGSAPAVAAACERCQSLLVSTERSILAVQEHNTASVKAQLQQFIPQDFRGALLERQRAVKEACFKKHVDDLVKRGGTIRQKYDLYLQQQWERRQALVQLGECSGMYKMVIKWVAGIPQVLLDFAKEINAKLGPMEEQRIKYGPDLYGITELGIRLDVCLAVWAESVAATLPEAYAAQLRLLDVVEPAVGFYCEQMLRVVRHIGDVFQHSPFFVNKDDLEKQHEGGGERNGVAEAAASATVATVAKQHVNEEWISSNMSGTSVSCDDGGSADTSTPPTGTGTTAVVAPLPLLLSLAPSVTAPMTPGKMLEGPPRAETMLSMSSSQSGIVGLRDEGKRCVDTAAAASCSGNATDKLASTAVLCLGVGPDAAHNHLAVSALHVTPPPQQQQQPELVQLHGLSSIRSGLRARLSHDSHASFISALEQQPWYCPDEGVGELKPLAWQQQQQQQQCDQHEEHLHQKQHPQHQQIPKQRQQQRPLGEDNAKAAHAQQLPSPPRGCLSGCIGRRKSLNPGSTHQRQQLHNGYSLQTYKQAQQQRAPR
ncbi:hypothetical protein VaNZ11_005353 [Volvox africanus]|uniref:Uncharacterized protein n=1 Tax=Volvox africanus TaxID=51714 RepID=A0ABQ5S058_9CHLO|nr:hypothetical protein VaNZ11_005353 [Volvox africanus]